MEGHEETLADTSQISSLGTSDSKTTLPGAQAVPFSSQLPTVHPIPCVHLFFFGPHCLTAFLGRMVFKKSLSIYISSTSVPKKPCLCPTTGGNATCFYYSLHSSLTRKGQLQLLNSWPFRVKYQLWSPSSVKGHGLQTFKRAVPLLSITCAGGTDGEGEQSHTLTTSSNKYLLSASSASPSYMDAIWVTDSY